MILTLSYCGCGFVYASYTFYAYSRTIQDCLLCVRWILDYYVTLSHSHSHSRVVTLSTSDVYCVNLR
jgi:hypothetical protein